VHEGSLTLCAVPTGSVSGAPLILICRHNRVDICLILTKVILSIWSDSKFSHVLLLSRLMIFWWSVNFPRPRKTPHGLDLPLVGKCATRGPLPRPISISCAFNSTSARSFLIDTFGTSRCLSGGRSGGRRKLFIWDIMAFNWSPLILLSGGLGSGGFTQTAIYVGYYIIAVAGGGKL